MERMVPRTAGTRAGGLGKDSNLNSVSEGASPVQPFDGIDWAAAAPSWAAIITGLVLPSLAVVALVILIDAALCSLLERWTNHSWGAAPWLLSIMVLPLALICAFCCGKVCLHVAGRSAITKS